jgi:membrane fusion protein, multidrug efflux system
MLPKSAILKHVQQNVKVGVIMTEETPDKEATVAKEMGSENKRKKHITLACIAFILIGIISFILWWSYFRIRDTTEDAYVHGNMTIITSQIPGIVSSINVDNTFLVKKNQVLFEIDPTIYQLVLKERGADLAQTVREVAALFDNVIEREADVELTQAQLIKAEQDYQHREPVVNFGGVSTENFEHSVAQLKSAQAEVKRSKAAYNAAVAKVENTTIYTHPLVISAQEKVKEAYINLKRTKIVAPFDGIVDQRRVQLGEWIFPTQRLLVIIPVDEIWVNANFKETELDRVRIGQPVEMHADFYGSEVTYHGKVVGIGSGTGSVFSIIPPQNASGNWIKILQRLPVRISLDKNEIQEHPLRIGLSMKVTINTKNLSGRVLQEPKDELPSLYSTDVYHEQIKDAQALVDEIISTNIPLRN